MDAKTETFLRIYGKSLLEKNAAIFAGAGLSRPSGFVDWKGLLRQIAKDLGLDVDKEQDLVGLAQFHINEKGGNRSRINQTLIEEFTRDSIITPNLEILTGLPINTYWTTNYDTLIEDALKQAGKTPDVKITQENLAVTRPRRDAVVYKMHGDISLPENAVISKDDYEAYNLRRPLFSATLQGDLVSKTFLFVGFSFNDPNLDQILGRIRLLLGENQREHFCFFKRVSKADYHRPEDFHYDTTKQVLRINDLKRYSIEGILVDDYPQITELLIKLRDWYKTNTIFISGSAAYYGAWGEDRSLKFVYDLACRLATKDYRIVSGFGLGTGSTVINGCLDHVYSGSYRHLDEYLVLRPFPQIVTGPKSREELWREYRRDMISDAGVALFLFGNKKDENGNIVEADGVYQEFEIAKALGLKIIPIGATSFAARKIWEQVRTGFESFFPGYPDLEPYFETLGNSSEGDDKLITTILKIVSRLRGI